MGDDNASTDPTTDFMRHRTAETLAFLRRSQDRTEKPASGWQGEPRQRATKARSTSHITQVFIRYQAST